MIPPLVALLSLCTNLKNNHTGLSMQLCRGHTLPCLALHEIRQLFRQAEPWYTPFIVSLAFLDTAVVPHRSGLFWRE